VQGGNMSIEQIGGLSAVLTLMTAVIGLITAVKDKEKVVKHLIHTPIDRIDTSNNNKKKIIIWITFSILSALLFYIFCKFFRWNRYR
jgi:hypothetical protein